MLLRLWGHDPVVVPPGGAMAIASGTFTPRQLLLVVRRDEQEDAIARDLSAAFRPRPFVAGFLANGATAADQASDVDLWIKLPLNPTELHRLLDRVPRARPK